MLYNKVLFFHFYFFIVIMGIIFFQCVYVDKFLLKIVRGKFNSNFYKRRIECHWSVTKWCLPKS